MAGTWTDQDKIIPGAYVNIKTNIPLSITPGERGVAVILQECSVGTEGDIYTITATDASQWPAGATDADKLLANEALKCCKTVKVYVLPEDHVKADVDDALAALETMDFNVICYPYSTATAQLAIKTWVVAQREDEGKKVQAVMANYTADSEACINVTQGVVLANGTSLSALQVCAWVAGAAAGATIVESITGKKYEGAVDVTPRMTKSQMETALEAGNFIFKVDSAENVTAVYDINSLTTFTPAKSKMFRKNRVLRTLDGISTDITTIFEAGYVGKMDNNEEGRAILKGQLCDYFNSLMTRGAIADFDAADVEVEKGVDSDAVVVTCMIRPVDAVEKIYITVNLA